MKKFVFVLISIICFNIAFAQDDDGYNDYSLRPIHESDIMYKKTIIRSLDLREKQNLPLFADNRQLTKFLIEGAKAGLISVYRNDSLDQGTKLTLDEFLGNLAQSDDEGLSEEEKEFMEANEADMEDDGFGNAEETSMGPDYWGPRDL